ncbi:hypothetical protein DWQ65_07860 [Treponema phagedenis]|uniref:Zn-dependent exopeptidase M28 n=1 Tax=Treponema phagedenis TaxID=162 RepID=A0A0B7GU31_TREPH|nr:M28 family peptidase [Treponema phagedenis]QEJ96012.1 Zn-dependent exopeptidase M28 [Treponema phagedenis]QEJ98972.1 Zn-dependent exopeptidase M28 [Treponema phagedenis]QEK01778.1 Zn-dependent exopeptidase M28 [Treponema phagedenis]QEK04480.1 Zn-dependent exopeptidase M28 [Treponema phagedenis]QEK06891.1 Zn-dependent exopeptidase M28 [Treponema phagedenis]
MDKNTAAAIIHSSLFKSFVQLGIDRAAFISAWLRAHAVPHTVVDISGNKNIIVRYDSSAYNPIFKTKILVGHYDRAEGTQGANDNSAACMQLMLFAEHLVHVQDFHNIKIIFTEGEEKGAKGIRNQGAYALGTGLRKLRMDNEEIYVFDCCGRGDTLILSESGIYGRDSDKTQGLQAFHERCIGYAQRACPNRFLSLLTPYSDNAGFIAAGITAQVFTVLPAVEAGILLKNIPVPKSGRAQEPRRFFSFQKKSKTAAEELTDLVIKNKKPDPDSPLAALIPKTWQLMHTEKDAIDSLTPEAFLLMFRFLRFLETVKEP